MLDMLDRACPTIIEQVLPHLPGSEKVTTVYQFSLLLSLEAKFMIFRVLKFHKVH